MGIKKKSKWIQAAHPKKGALHRQLGYAEVDALPLGMLKDIQKAKPGNHIQGIPSRRY